MYKYDLKTPKVSVIIPVYNGANYLKHAIECAVNQTYRNLEIIVVNDGSTDDGETERIALSYGDRIKYFCKPNGGVSSALNYGINQMTGEYFSWLSHDDGYSETKVADAVETLEAHSKLDMSCVAFTGGYFMDSYGQKIKDFRLLFDADKLYTGLDVVNIMTKKGTLNGCCMLIPKRAFDDVGYFDERLRYSQDSLMWYKIFLNGYSLVSNNKPTVTYRLHRKQASQTSRLLYEHDARIIAELLSEPLLKADSTGKLLCRYIKRHTKYNCKQAIDYLYDFAESRECLNFIRRLSLNVAKLIGFFRYHAVSKFKKLLITFKK